MLQQNFLQISFFIILKKQTDFDLYVEQSLFQLMKIYIMVFIFGKLISKKFNK